MIASRERVGHILIILQLYIHNRFGGIEIPSVFSKRQTKVSFVLSYNQYQ
jgi:hypothetical protein